jgi:hypothetical protein
MQNLSLALGATDDMVLRIPELLEFIATIEQQILGQRQLAQSQVQSRRFVENHRRPGRKRSGFESSAGILLEKRPLDALIRFTAGECEARGMAAVGSSAGLGVVDYGGGDVGDGVSGSARRKNHPRTNPVF